MGEKARLLNVGEMFMELFMALILLGVVIGGGVSVKIGDINIGNSRKDDQ